MGLPRRIKTLIWTQSIKDESSAGLEPATSRLTVERANQLRHEDSDNGVRSHMLSFRLSVSSRILQVSTNLKLRWILELL